MMRQNVPSHQRYFAINGTHQSALLDKCMHPFMTCLKVPDSTSGLLQKCFCLCWQWHSARSAIRGLVLGPCCYLL
jgi:hypothetical protein